ncbi:MAG: 4'-phosphopantetheinyl transferase family protein, partial [Gemmatimonadota bacterium]
MTHIGNDVVDLRDPRCRGKEADERFLRRVFTDDERRAIVEATDPAPALWIRWAAKEAGFKVVTKLLGSPPPFEHRAFRV